MLPIKMFKVLPIALFAAGVHAAPNPVVPDPQWFQRNTRAPFDALAPGDTAVWQNALADDCIITDEDGTLQTKAEPLNDLRPLPPGFSGSIRIKNLEVRDLGSAAVVAT